MELARLEGVYDGDRVVWSSDGSRLAISSAFGDILVLDISALTKVRQFITGESSTKTVAISPDGVKLAWGSDKGEVVLVEVATGSDLRALPSPGGLLSLAFSADGKTLGSWYRSDELVGVRMWGVASGNELPTPIGRLQGTGRIAFTPDWRLLALVVPDPYGNVKLWESASGRELGTFNRYYTNVLVIALSADGGVLATGSGDGSVRVWHLASGSGPLVMSGHKNSITSLSFSPDGKVLASGSVYDKTLRLWDVATGKELRMLYESRSWVSSVIFSPDGRLLASTGDGVRLWGVP